MKREDTEKRLRELELFCGLRLVPGAWTLLRLRWARLHPLHRGALREAVRRPPARSHDRRGPGGERLNSRSETQFPERKRMEPEVPLAAG